MRVRAILGSALASVTLLVIGWQAGASLLAATPLATTTSQPGHSGSTTSTTPSGGGVPSTTATAAPTAGGAADGTYTGSSVSTRFGSVQVAVTISNGTIADVTPVHLTDADRRSVDISNRAAPVLRQEVLAAQSSQVSNVGGATYTTRAYLGSLQSALDQAGF